MLSDESSLDRLRLATALQAGRLAGALSRRLGQGAGTVVRGRVVLALAPDALRSLAAGRRSVVVTGTNGKSTTTRLISAALGEDVATNSSGANMGPGLVTALDDERGSVAVLETDELHVPAVMRSVEPAVVVALNLTRDQLDRTHEVSRTSGVWGTAFGARPVTVVANAADPHVVAAALRGASAVWVDPGLRWTEDATVCPRCGQLLDWTDGRWSSGCGLVMPEPDYVLTETGVRLPDGRDVPFEIKLPGVVNRGNAVFALAVAGVFGIPAEEAAARLADVDVVDGRYAELDLGGRPARLFLAKNPAGWAAALAMIEPGAQLIVGINARIADGTDTSWLYDVPFERLRGRVVGAIGDRRDDLAVRLHYAGAIPTVHTDPVALAATLPPGPLVVAANYTAFRELRSHVAV
ncbi:MAG: Lipid isoglutaminyl synthase (glutamine-hydrolyzing) subunit MurT [Actinomycetota bacterium]|nr:Lipid isoglutaminyl synthase (glutamine-hydrolyzing) subunit MurT [Actinomycetota bacterium]